MHATGAARQWVRCVGCLHAAAGCTTHHLAAAAAAAARSPLEACRSKARAAPVNGQTTAARTHDCAPIRQSAAAHTWPATDVRVCRPAAALAAAPLAAFWSCSSTADCQLCRTLRPPCFDSTAESSTAPQAATKQLQAHPATWGCQQTMMPKVPPPLTVMPHAAAAGSVNNDVARAGVQAACVARGMRTCHGTGKTKQRSLRDARTVDSTHT